MMKNKIKLKHILITIFLLIIFSFFITMFGVHEFMKTSSVVK